MFGVVNRGQLPGSTEHEFENLNSRLKGLWLTEHNDDGTHNIGAMDFSSLRLQAGNISSGVFDPSLIPDLDASKITSGTLSSARLPANVAYIDAANVFTANQKISLTRPEAVLKNGATTALARFAKYSTTGLHLAHNMAYDGTNWNLDDTGSNGAVVISDPSTDPLQLWTATAGANPRTLSEIFKVDASGKIYERSRTVAIGDEIPITPTLSAATGTWTTGAGSLSCGYTQIGDFIIIRIDAENTTLSSNTANVVMTFPFTFTNQLARSAIYFKATWNTDGYMLITSGGTSITWNRSGAANFTSGSGFYIRDMIVAKI